MKLKEFIFACTLIHGFNVVISSQPCALREEEHGFVCVCTATYCDYLDNPEPDNEHEFIVVSSTKAGLRFNNSTGQFNHFRKTYILDHDHQQQETGQKATNTRTVRIEIDRTRLQQKIVGFGGSFTGAVSYLLQQMPEALQDHVYKSYYSAEGIGFNLLRISIGGCDFDFAPWAYNEEPENDVSLSNFTKLDPRDEVKITQIKRMMEVSNSLNLRIKAAAWSSPPWMKSNNKWTGFSRLKQEFYQTWADYHIKWLELMEKNGLPIWAISTGNEPTNGVAFMYFVKFMSLGWTPKNQAIWLSDHLGPTLRSSKFKDIILFGNDDQRYTYTFWFHQMNKTRSDSLQYLDGLAVHWYWNEIFNPSIMDKAHAEMPDKIMLTTESCIGDKPWQKAVPLLGSWQRAEKYVRAFYQDLHHNFNGWIDWNIILDENGGPNYVNNTVDAPLIMKSTNSNEVLKQPIFYGIGHFTKFIPEGSVKIQASRSNVNVDAVAFAKPDGNISVVIFNSGNANVEVNILDSERGAAVINIPPRSIHTILYK